MNDQIRRTTWGIVPAAGAGSRIQPLAFSKELLPVGSRVEDGKERPRAVSEYLVERMIRGGANRLCFVIAPGKTDILEYYGARLWGADIAYVVQPHPGGLCDAIFRAIPLVREDDLVVVGLPDTIWSPENGLAMLPDHVLSFLLFPVDKPELFDAVCINDVGQVTKIQVKEQGASSRWIWGAFKVPGSIFHALHQLWCRPERADEYFGTLVNAWIAAGGEAVGLQVGTEYVDVGTLHGYRAALHLLEEKQQVTLADPGRILKDEGTYEPATASGS